MNEFRVTDQGELDLGLTAPPAGPRPAARPPHHTTAAAASCPPNASQAPGAAVPDDDWPAGTAGPPGTGPSPVMTATRTPAPTTIRRGWQACPPLSALTSSPGRGPAPGNRSRPGSCTTCTPARPVPGSPPAASWTPCRPARGSPTPSPPPPPQRRRARRAGRVGADRRAVRVAADRVVGRGRRGRRRAHPRPPPGRR